MVYFQARLNNQRQSAEVGELALKASCQVALWISQKKKSYTIAEDFLLPAASEKCKTMFGNDEYVNKLKTIPLLDTTIARTDDMTSGVRVQLVEKLRLAKAFALQLDESTDASRDNQLLAFVRFLDPNEMQEELLFCKQLPERTESDQCLFQRKCVALCTDGARAMAGLKSGLIALVKDLAPQVMWTHCMLHRESLVAK